MYPAKTEEYLKNLKSVFQNLNYPKSRMYTLNLMSVDIICSQKQTVFRNHSSRKAEFQETDNVQGKISEHVFKAKLCLYYASNIFCNTYLGNIRR